MLKIDQTRKRASSVGDGMGRVVGYGCFWGAPKFCISFVEKCCIFRVLAKFAYRAAAQIIYLNSCQSRFSGMYLVLQVFRETFLALQ